MLLPEQDIPIASYCEYDLVKLAQEGSERAMEVLFERYQTRLSLYLARMVGNDGIGCELTQETFVKAWESLPRLRDPVLFKSWLYRIATNVAYDHLRSTRRFHSFQWLSFSIIHYMTILANGLTLSLQLAEVIRSHSASPSHRLQFSYLLQKTCPHNLWRGHVILY